MADLQMLSSACRKPFWFSLFSGPFFLEFQGGFYFTYLVVQFFRFKSSFLLTLCCLLRPWVSFSQPQFQIIYASSCDSKFLTRPMWEADSLPGHLVGHDGACCHSAPSPSCTTLPVTQSIPIHALSHTPHLQPFESAFSVPLESAYFSPFPLSTPSSSCHHLPPDPGICLPPALLSSMMASPVQSSCCCHSDVLKVGSLPTHADTLNPSKASPCPQNSTIEEKGKQAYVGERQA